MASRVAILRSIVGNTTACSSSGSRQWIHNAAAAAMAPSLNNCLHHPSLPPPLLFPWSLPNPDRDGGEWSNHVGIDGDLGGIGSPGFPLGEAMELAVPKKKVSPHKRGIRNGPKALKPTPVIIRCMVCGRVKLPHFYCCSGHKENANEKNG